MRPSLRSGQLGRQVGAALATEDGEVLSVGCNDVPKSGGGLYWPSPLDNRDHILGEDTNDKQRDNMVAQLLCKFEDRSQKRISLIKRSLELLRTDEESNRKIAEIIDEISKFDAENAGHLQAEFRSIVDVTEYGRAVHAEMDAILTAARFGVSPKGLILFTTTFPCHNCTRHIIASGIKRVYYIEPYAKSRAEQLHEDAIIVEERVLGKQRKGIKRVRFTHFVGIGPRRYFDLFSLALSSGHELARKKAGQTFANSPKTAWVRVPLSPHSYISRERIAVVLVDSLGMFPAPE